MQVGASVYSLLRPAPAVLQTNPSAKTKMMLSSGIPANSGAHPFGLRLAACGWAGSRYIGTLGTCVAGEAGKPCGWVQSPAETGLARSIRDGESRHLHGPSQEQPRHPGTPATQALARRSRALSQSKFSTTLEHGLRTPAQLRTERAGGFRTLASLPSQGLPIFRATPQSTCLPTSPLASVTTWVQPRATQRSAAQCFLLLLLLLPDQTRLFLQGWHPPPRRQPTACARGLPHFQVPQMCPSTP